MNDKVLVTGGAGYIGSHVCKRLARDGWVPVTYDNFSTGHRWAVKWGPLVEGDVTDRAGLENAITEHSPVAVMHFAALSCVGESVSAPGSYYRNNVVGALTLLEAMRDSGIDRLVFSSSCAVYGEPETDVLTESHPCRPVNPYGATKLATELMIRDFAGASGLRSVVLRYFNAAGADPDAEIGEDHEPETHLVPLLLQAASGRRDGITIFGDDYPTPDGTCIRDYIDVSDLAGAHVRALEVLMQERDSMTVNLGTGRGYSVMELLRMASSVTGRDIAHHVGPRRAGDPARLVASNERAENLLGWRPLETDLEAMLARAWAWEMRQAAPVDTARGK